MKKITLLFAALLLVAIGAKAQTINNPKDANGYYIVKWDCNANDGQGGWAASNDFEVDEAFTFAVDVSGTAFEDWLKQPATNAGATRGIAINRWSGFGAFQGDINRLKPITGNIYGATWCFTQAALDFDVTQATQIDSITYFAMQVFGFEYTADNAGASWYVNAVGIDGPDGNAFTSAPYTGTKTSVDFYADDYDGFWDYTVGGYAPSCAVIDRADTGNTGIPAVKADSSPVVSHEYYNLLGIKLAKEPVSGLFIDKALKADGTTVATKVLKPLK
jgi:hypothetical protein